MRNQLSNHMIAPAKIIDFFIWLVTLTIIFSINNSADALPFIGWGIIGISCYIIIRVKKNSMLFLLMTIIGLINISVGINDCILKGINVSYWQFIGMRATDYNTITAKTILLFLPSFNLILKVPVINSDKQSDSLNTRLTNDLIGYGGIIVLYVILVYAVLTQLRSRNVGDYQSVSSPIFEYGVIMLCITWYYSRNIIWVNRLILLYVALYSIIFLFIGDRSSVFMYLIITYLLYFKEKVSEKSIFALAIVGIILANFIGIVRDTSNITIKEGFELTVKRGLYVDTVSWSYYAGITIVALSRMVSSRSVFCIKYLLAFVGFGSEYSNFPSYAANNYSSLYNLGGGLCSPYLYMFGGYFGVVFGAFFIAIIINYLFKDLKGNRIIYQALIIAMSFRWYLYNPLVLFRGILIITTFLLIGCRLICNLTKKDC